MGRVEFTAECPAGGHDCQWESLTSPSSAIEHADTKPMRCHVCTPPVLRHHHPKPAADPEPVPAPTPPLPPYPKGVYDVSRAVSEPPKTGPPSVVTRMDRALRRLLHRGATQPTR
jgi:hypothetical protein